MHKANLFASPTVSPSKSLPLRREKKKRRQVKPAATSARTSATDGSRHKLGGVVLLPLQQVALAPPQEIVQRRLRVYVDLDVVFVCPHLQADQQDPDVERSIELRRGGDMFIGEPIPGRRRFQER